MGLLLTHYARPHTKFLTVPHAMKHPVAHVPPARPSPVVREGTVAGQITIRSKAVEPAIEAFHMHFLAQPSPCCGSKGRCSAFRSSVGNRPMTSSAQAIQRSQTFADSIPIGEAVDLSPKVVRQNMPPARLHDRVFHHNQGTKSLAQTSSRRRSRVGAPR